MLINYHKSYSDFFQSAILENGEIYKNILFSQKNNSGGYDSLVITSPMTMYRPKIDSALIARIKTNSKKPYISFKAKYEKWFKDRGIPTYSIKSDVGFFRIELSDFQNVEKEENYKDFCKLIIDLYLDAVNFPQFGCCDKFKQCSDQQNCIHEDLLYSTACMYRKNLENGKIFYGKNKNI